MEPINPPNPLDNGDLYARQSTLRINREQTVAIIGCGGIGSWVALELALAGVEHLELFDADTISEHNRNRLPFPVDAVGKQKSVALADLLLSLRPDIEVSPRGNFDPRLAAHKEVLSHCSWVAVSTDSMKSRRLVWDTLQTERYTWVRYIELGAEGHRANVTFSPPEFSTPEEEQPGYRSVPVFVGPCTLAASIAAYYILLPSDAGILAEKTFLIDWRGSLQLRTIWDHDDEAMLAGEPPEPVTMPMPPLEEPPEIVEDLTPDGADPTDGAEFHLPEE